MPTPSVLPPEATTAAVAVGAGGLPEALFPGFSRPVQVEIARHTAPARVAAIIPCHNRPEDARALLGDLAKLDPSGVDLRLILVDNASAQPLADLPIPAGLNLEHLRLSTNTGGSGGFSAGISQALSLDPSSHTPHTPGTPHARPSDSWRSFDAQFLWLVDSDARVFPDTLSRLLAVLQHNDRVVAAGPAIADPLTGRCFELGGHINPRSGLFEPMVPGAAGVVGERPASQAHDPLIPCDYIASCCALVRADAARTVGVFPDTFLNGDDVEWFIRMAQRTGGKIVAVPAARAMHPRFDRFPTWTRYYTTRNSQGPLIAAGPRRASRRARFRRAARDALRAAQQHMAGRPDLALLHMLGLKHAASGRTTGSAPEGTIRLAAPTPIGALVDEFQRRVGTLSGRCVAVHPALGIPDAERAAILDALRTEGCRLLPLAPATGGRALVYAMRRWLFGPRTSIALVPARGRPDSWFAGAHLIQVAPGYCSIRTPSRITAPARAATSLAVGLARAARAVRRPGHGPSPLDTGYRAAHSGAGRSLSVETVVLSYQRWPALEATVERLLGSPAFDGRGADPDVRRTITIVDNGSRDGVCDRIETFLVPRGVNFIELGANLGVEAFNRAVAASTADAVLILDDDASPDEDALLIAIDELASRPDLGAVTLHPRHPKTGLSEWPFAAKLAGAPSDRWPVMGCANLIRRADWQRVGGYEPKFFLYRNDADLALKLLAADRGVYFDPALVAWHDSPAGPGKSKSPRWHELATRNWIWMARRHARGSGAAPPVSAFLGWLWAHKLAGLSVERHLATLRGAWAGLTSAVPSLGSLRPDGSHLRRLLSLRR